MNLKRTARPTIKAPEFDYFFKTIQSRGFANKMTPEMVQMKAKMLDYTTICKTIETLMVSYTESES